jgi:hypothetical protein
MRTSTPSAGGPQVPILIRSGGLIVTQQESSDITNSSQIGRPRASKYSSTWRGVGAPPTTGDRAVLRAVDEHDPLDGDLAAPDRGPDLRHEAGFGDHHPGARVREQVLDLLGRGRVVDRERDRPRCSAAVSTTLNSGRLTSINPTVSPRPMPSDARPPAIRRTRYAYSR